MKESMHKIAGFIFFLLLTGSGLFSQTLSTIENEIEAVEKGLSQAYYEKGKPKTYYNLEERMRYFNVPGVSIAFVKNGKIHWKKAYGIANTNSGSKVESNTLFQAGSISKPLAALAALKLYEDGKLNLDEDVNKYLKDWKVEESAFTQKEKVTVRRLLTHSAGTTVHGFPGYKQSDEFPSDIEVLNGEGNTDKVEINVTPGTIWRYSGGGYTIMEKVVEDITGMEFSDYADQFILQPLGMMNSTYAQPLPEKWYLQASAAYDSDGKIASGLWHNYPEQAAAGLWTTPEDLAKYCIEIQEIIQGKENGILNVSTVKEMLTKHKNDWGLGPSLAWSGDSLRFQHGGKNMGFSNNLIAFAFKGIAVIVMTNADNGTKLMNEIIRSVSDYYGLGIDHSKEVKLAKLSYEELLAFTGLYKLDQDVPGIGEYIVNLTVENGKIVVMDPNSGETDIISPMDKKNFIDLEDGDRVIFQKKENKNGFLWNNRFQFYKID